MSKSTYEWRELIEKAYALYQQRAALTVDNTGLLAACEPLRNVIRELRDEVESPPMMAVVAVEDQAEGLRRKFRETQNEHHTIKNFVECRSQRDNDCGVVTYANITQCGYKEARKVAFLHGWSSLAGMNPGLLEHALNKKGWRHESRAALAGSTLQNLASNMPEGTYLVYTESHAMAATGGKIYNWASCGLHRVKEVVELWPNEK